MKALALSAFLNLLFVPVNPDLCKAAFTSHSVPFCTGNSDTNHKLV